MENWHRQDASFYEDFTVQEKKQYRHIKPQQDKPRKPKKIPQYYSRHQAR